MARKNACIDCGEPCKGRRCWSCWSERRRPPSSRCQDCGEECNGKRCRTCYERSRSRTLRPVTCPNCGATRMLNHRSYWAAMNREVPGRCNPCGRRALRDDARSRAEAVLASGVKRCPGCDRTLPHDRFSRCAKHLDGLASYCKECDRLQIRDWYSRNRQRAALTAKAWARRHPLRRRAITHNWYGRSRDPNAERIDYEALMREHGWVCHICRDPIASIDELAFDHVLAFANGGRHTAQNIRPAHFLCNARKGDRPFP